MYRLSISLVLLCILSLRPIAAADGVEGRWMLSVQDKKRIAINLAGHLAIENKAAHIATVSSDYDVVAIGFHTCRTTFQVGNPSITGFFYFE